jgi:hypothetical protein
MDELMSLILRLLPDDSPQWIAGMLVGIFCVLLVYRQLKTADDEKHSPEMKAIKSVERGQAEMGRCLEDLKDGQTDIRTDLAEIKGKLSR